MPCLGEHLGQGLPEAEGAVADREDGGTHTAAGGIAQQVRTGLGRFTVAVSHRDQLLGAVRAHAHHDQDAGLRLRQADAQMGAVKSSRDDVLCIRRPPISGNGRLTATVCRQ